MVYSLFFALSYAWHYFYLYCDVFTIKNKTSYALVFMIIISCGQVNRADAIIAATDISALRFADGAVDSSFITAYQDTGLHKDAALAEKLVAFSKTLLGTPYKFGCTMPAAGFDCSGFITYVFNHFNITVPRSSVDFTHEGTTVSLEQAKPGDLILFTGTNSKKRVVGHIGLVTANDNGIISFIHSSSGKEFSVIITQLNDYYMSRFVKVIRLVP
jgi:NlpC/P60 family